MLRKRSFTMSLSKISRCAVKMYPLQKRRASRLISIMILSLMTCCLSSRAITAQQLSERSSIEDPLIIHTLYINAHKSSGWPWDSKPLGAPDPYVKIYHYGELSWTSRSWRDELQPIRAPYETSVFRRAERARDDSTQAMKIEVWDRDVLQDDLISTHLISQEQLALLRAQPLTVRSRSTLMKLSWRSTPQEYLKPTSQRAAQREAQREFDTLKVVSSTDRRPKLQRPLSKAHLPTCAEVPRDVEATIDLKLKRSPQEIFKRAQALVMKKQADFKSFNVSVRPCAHGYDISSRFGLGRGWVRLSEGVIRVHFDRPRLARAFPSTSRIKRRVIRSLCRRVLRGESPQCPRR